MMLTVVSCGWNTGAATLERGDVADLVNTEARQRLREVVQRSHPSEKLRYSTLLLNLHTLFGINCGMLQTLFFRPMHRAANIDEFVSNALRGQTSTSPKDSDMVE